MKMKFSVKFSALFTHSFVSGHPNTKTIKQTAFYRFFLMLAHALDLWPRFYRRFQQKIWGYSITVISDYLQIASILEIVQPPKISKFFKNYNPQDTNHRWRGQESRSKPPTPFPGNNFECAALNVFSLLVKYVTSEIHRYYKLCYWNSSVENDQEQKKAPSRYQSVQHPN